MSFLKFDNEDIFSTGMGYYNDNPDSGSEVSARIVIQVQIAKKKTTAILDTAAPYVICSPDIAKEAELDPSDSFEDYETIVRGIKLKGGLLRAPIQFIAAEGNSLSIEAVIFVPDSEKAPIFNFPSFIGLTGCLEWIRFAVDPSNETFYFGPRPQ